MTIVDPQLQILFEETPVGEREDVTVSVLFEWHGDTAPLEAAGLRLRSTQGGIISADMQLSRLPDVEAVGIGTIELSKRLYPTLDVSRPEIKAHNLKPILGADPGKGVIVGIIDTGIDYAHPAFLDSAGKSRILHLWDQRLRYEKPQPGKPPKYAWEKPASGAAAKVPDSVEYDQAGIDAALAAKKSLRTSDSPRGHGTHVAAIAAGNGQAPMGETGGKYIGVATHAHLIVVATKDTEGFNGLRYGIEYVFERAKQLGLPCVVNVSMSMPHGARDGKTAEEKALDALLGDPGRALVFSAGNAAGEGMHATGRVASGQKQQVKLAVSAKDPADRFLIEVWYGLEKDTERFDLEVAQPGGGGTLKLAAPTGDKKQAFVKGALGKAGNLVRLWSFVALAPTAKNRLVIEISRDKQPNMIADGQWTIALTGKTVGAAAKDGTFHAYLSRPFRIRQKVSDPVYATFLTPHVKDAYTIGFPATAKKVISTASYITKAPGTVGQLSTFSSQGPTLDERKAPTISAPGQWIFSARAGNTRKKKDSAYFSMRGTSMAAPHVTGVVAAMLQADPTLTQNDIIDILRSTVRKPGVASPDENHWGRGMINAEAAVQKAKE